MKILYVGTERAEAQAIATVVNSLGERVRVSWTSGLDGVANWIDQNDGLRVLVVEAQPNGSVWRSVLIYLAGLAAALPVVVIVPEESASDLQPLALEGHECVARSLLRDLPAVITRAIAQARQRQLERAMRDMVHEQFHEAALEVERVRLRHASAVADAERLAQREAELSAQLESATTTRDVLERRLADAETAVHAGEASLADTLNASTAAEQRHASAMTAAVAQSRELQATLSAARQELESKAAHLDALATAEAGLREQIRRERAERSALDAEIAAAGAARAEARRETESAAADVARLTECEASLTCELTDAHAALLDAQQRHDVALALAAGDRAARQAHFDREQDQSEVERTGLTAQLREVEEARDQARREHQAAIADITRLTEREAELEGRLKEERATRDTLEQEVAGTAAALRDAQQRHDVALTTAASELAERQAHFEREQAQAEAERAGLSARLREVEEARDQARREHQAAIADITRLTEREAELEERLTEGRATRETLEQAVAATAAALQDAQQRHAEALTTAAGDLAERQAHFERERAQAETERAGLTAQLQEGEEARDQARHEHQSAVADITRLTEHTAAEREAAAACQTDLESRMNALRAAALVHAAEFDEKLEHAHTEASAVIHRLTDDIEQLRISLETRVEELEVTTRQREVLQAEADQLGELRHELNQSRADNHRLFLQAPLPMFRCTKDGVLTHANRMLTSLVGRSADELRGANLAAATFESPNDLSWLIERCVSSKVKESTETTWRRKDGSRLLVRLSACATSSDLIECGVEDLTPIRVLQDRLSQAHRMEAVGRLANEVAVTCSSLLGGVHQNVQQWLVTDGGHHASQQHGEMLVEEISRAAGLLRQLAIYGDEESRRPAVVELRTVVREVAPVLKRVAGDAVEVQLPAASTPLNVDAGSERVKRLLVNLAAYGRERMPFGGRLKIELGTIVVDRHFAAKHPNVRLGPHALVTVTESRRATRTDGPLQLHDNGAGSSSRSVAIQNGVDLGTLQELVAECGGHLWMTVEPVGDMVVKIRLPLVTSYGEPPRRTSAPGGRVRLGRWFQQ
jgi:PAS domain S-box-containing protein